MFFFFFFFWRGVGESKIIFKIQEKVMRLISNVESDASCGVLFQTLNILPVSCMCIMEIVYFIKMNIGGSGQHSVWHDCNTHQHIIDQIFNPRFVDLI
jgi:hypothetical protein